MNGTHIYVYTYTSLHIHLYVCIHLYINTICIYIKSQGSVLIKWNVYLQGESIGRLIDPFFSNLLVRKTRTKHTNQRVMKHQPSV